MPPSRGTGAGFVLTQTSSPQFVPTVTYTNYTNFTFTGSVQTWAVPFGITEINVTLKGAAGNSTQYPGGNRVPGGNGAVFTTPLSTSGLTTIYVFVGGTDGWDGGGAGGISNDTTQTFPSQYGGSGGGQSMLCTGGPTCNQTQANVLADAGGGGGAGGSTGNHPSGGGAGGAGGSGPSPIPSGGPAPASGANALGGGNPGNGGTGAGVGSTGPAGTGGALTGGGTAGQNGGKLFGGNGSAGTNAPTPLQSHCTPANGGGGGGGGGYFGGGGGSGGGGGGGAFYSDCDAGGGGGGGSSYVNASAVPATRTPGAVTATNTGNGSISIEYTGNDALSAGAVTPGNPAIDSRQSITLSSHITGGHGRITYQWYSATNVSNRACVNGTAMGSSNAATYTTPALVASTYFCYFVADGFGLNASSGWDLVTVNPALVANPVTPPSPVFDSGQNVTLVSNATGGTPVLSYQWFNSSSNSGTCNTGTSIMGGNNTTLKVTTGGYYCYEVADSSSAGSVSVGSGWDPVGVNGPLVANPITPGSPLIDPGQSLVLHSAATGGTAPLKYEWAFSPTNTSACSAGSVSGSTQNITVSPTNAVYYCYVVNDSSPAGSLSAQSPWDPITVNTPLVAGPITPALPNITAGSSVTLSAHPSGGTNPYSYQWFSGTSSTCSLDSAIAGTTSATYSATPSANTYYCYRVTDNSQGTPSANSSSPTDLVSVTGVVQPLKITNFAASPNPVQVNASITISTAASGGVPPYSYSYGGLPSGCIFQDAATWTCTPRVAGTFTLTVTVTDKQGKTANDTFKLTVNPAVAGSPVIASFTATPSPIHLGNSTTVTVKATGGTPPYSYAYAGLPPGCSAGNVAQFTCTPTSPGNFTISVTVTDSVAKSASGSTVVSVVGKGSPIVVSLTANATFISLGGTVTLTGTLKGGVGPFQYVWSVNGVNSTSNQNLSWNYRPASSGTYHFILWINDARGEIAGSNSVSLTVTSGSSTTPPASSFLSSYYWLILLVIVVFALVLLLLYWGSRQRKQPTSVSEKSVDADGTAKAKGAAAATQKVAPEWSEEGAETAPASGEAHGVTVPTPPETQPSPVGETPPAEMPAPASPNPEPEWSGSGSGPSRPTESTVPLDEPAPAGTSPPPEPPADKPAAPALEKVPPKLGKARALPRKKKKSPGT